MSNTKRTPLMKASRDTQEYFEIEYKAKDGNNAIGEGDTRSEKSCERNKRIEVLIEDLQKRNYKFYKELSKSVARLIVSLEEKRKKNEEMMIFLDKQVKETSISDEDPTVLMQKLIHNNKKLKKELNKFESKLMSCLDTRHKNFEEMGTILKEQIEYEMSYKELTNRLKELKVRFEGNHERGERVLIEAKIKDIEKYIKNMKPL